MLIFSMMTDHGLFPYFLWLPRQPGVLNLFCEPVGLDSESQPQVPIMR